MKTLNEIKEEVAKSIGETSWESYRKNYIISERIFERVAHLYAREALDAAIELSHDFVVDTEDLIKLKDKLK